ncbi:MAG: glycosyltransferase family 1 protein [Tepidisphaeraceae bacterium]
MSSKLRIIVGGMVGQFPLGGVASDYFHYVLALHELGHDVYYHEDTNTWPYNPSIRQPSSDGNYNAAFIRAFFERYAPALVDRWHYRLLQDQCFGMSKEAFDAVAATADIYLNVSGVCLLPAALASSCRRVFLDSDPGYNQMGLQELLDTEGPTAKRYVEVAKDHDVHLTYAENIHAPDCQLPDAGLKWITTRPVVTLPHWADAVHTAPPAGAAYTTVMTLDLSKQPKRLHYKGVDYFDKRPEFEKFITLPKRVPQIPLSLAIGNHKGLEPVLENGWHVTDSHDASLTPEAYRQFIAASAGEWSIAKNVYAATRSGWFSCRTCCYLAAGRPAVVQDTAWSRYIPSGDGVIAFTTLEEAAAGLERLAADPERQRRAAYDVAREYLAPDRVIAPMLEAILAAPTA